ncbi:eCIS core domain-containing protein [Streptosporangium canum]|uniref:eCIS core domain-containing protein n=1 Tax=Streptosporangium canum TaxID=324952 RepID=UPI0033A0EFE9
MAGFASRRKELSHGWRADKPAAELGNWRAAISKASDPPGRQLDSGILRSFDVSPARAGFDFSKVRVHNDASAHAAAEQLSAQAFSVGSHIFFGQGAYRPTEQSGQELLRHEITHVMQNPRTSMSDLDALPLSDPDSAAEREASAAAATSGSLPSQPTTQPAVHRVLAANSTPRERLLPSALTHEAAGVSSVRSTADAARLHTALAGLVGAGKIEVTSVEGRDFFSLPATGAATLGEVTTALTSAGFPRAPAMATALVNRHNAWIFVGEEIYQYYSLVTIEISRSRDVITEIERPLTPAERAEAQLVFGPGLDYSRVRIVEDPLWGAGDTARTLPSVISFPPGSSTSPGYLPLLIHELTHTWQYQHGVGVARTGTTAFLCWLGIQSYNYGGEPELIARTKAGQGLSSFNTEQQGDIARDFYLRQKAGESTSAWAPFVAELQKPP